MGSRYSKLDQPPEAQENEPLSQDSTGDFSKEPWRLKERLLHFQGVDEHVYLDTQWNKAKDQEFNPHFTRPLSPYMGVPNPEVDRLWYDLSELRNFGVDRATLAPMNNVLYDSTTKRSTSTGQPSAHPCDEFLTGLWDIEEDFSVPPEGLSEDDLRKWEVAKAWDAAITRAKATRPSEIAGIERIQALRDLEDLLCPFALAASEVMLRRISDEDKAKKKKETEDKIGSTPMKP
ncbi:hypothetical protein F4809DRAFT_659250 [Biscogniauxia mediterranea]|nr:hypothetical protein F4809DRAFT_659250 [Biscogniauxia mediterranea]